MRKQISFILISAVVAASAISSAQAHSVRHRHHHMAHHHRYYSSFGMFRGNAEGAGNNGNSFRGSNSLNNPNNFGNN